MRALASFPVAFMCERLGVSRAGYYAWRARQANPTLRMVADVELTATIRTVHAASRGTYGVPRVTAARVWARTAGQPQACRPPGGLCGSSGAHQMQRVTA